MAQAHLNDDMESEFSDSGDSENSDVSELEEFDGLFGSSDENPLDW